MQETSSLALQDASNAACSWSMQHKTHVHPMVQHLSWSHHGIITLSYQAQIPARCQRVLQRWHALMWPQRPHTG